MKLLNKIIALVFLVGSMNQAYALCTRDTLDDTPTALLNLGIVNVPKNTPVGQVIARREFSHSGRIVNYNCNTNINLYILYRGDVGNRNPTAVPNMPGVFTTSISGIGVRLTALTTANGQNFNVSRFYRGRGVNANVIIRPGTASAVRVELIRIPGTIGAGGSLGSDGTAATMFLSDNPDNYNTRPGTTPIRQAFWAIIYGNTTITTSTDSCELVGGSRTIALATAQRSVFTGIGSRGPSVRFPLNYHCIRETGAATIPHISSLTYSYETTAERPDLMKNTAPDATKASGVVFKLFRYDANQPTTSIPISNGDTLNLGQTTQPSITDYNIDHLVQYYQDQPSIAGGDVASQVTITATYN